MGRSMRLCTLATNSYVSALRTTVGFCRRIGYAGCFAASCKKKLPSTYACCLGATHGGFRNVRPKQRHHDVARFSALCGEIHRTHVSDMEICAIVLLRVMSVPDITRNA